MKAYVHEQNDLEQELEMSNICITEILGLDELNDDNVFLKVLTCKKIDKDNKNIVLSSIYQDVIRACCEHNIHPVMGSVQVRTTHQIVPFTANTSVIPASDNSVD